MKNIVAGNVISLVAAVFTFASAWSRDRKRVYLYQAVQCLIMAAANIFFFSVSGVTTFILCAIRNLLLAYDRFTGKLCIVFVILVGALGLAANNRGVIGLLPVVTTAVYTVGCLFAVRPKTIKANIAVNLTLWALYNILISDFVSFAVDAGSAGAAVISIARLDKYAKGKTSHHESR